MDFAYSKSDLKYTSQCFDEEVQNNFGKYKNLVYVILYNLYNLYNLVI